MAVGLCVQNSHFIEISTGPSKEGSLTGQWEMDGVMRRIADEEIIHGGKVAAQDCSTGGVRVG